MSIEVSNYLKATNTRRHARPWAVDSKHIHILCNPFNQKAGLYFSWNLQFTPLTVTGHSHLQKYCIWWNASLARCSAMKGLRANKSESSALVPYLFELEKWYEGWCWRHWASHLTAFLLWGPWELYVKLEAKKSLCFCKPVGAFYHLVTLALIIGWSDFPLWSIGSSEANL